jgi:hypothetical protein
MDCGFTAAECGVVGANGGRRYCERCQAAFGALATSICSFLARTDHAWTSPTVPRDAGCKGTPSRCR